MMRDCRSGKIDCIYAKNVSRFARNALDCIEYVRELKKLTKEITIVESEAEVVRWIFNLFLDGKSALQIKNWLEENDIKTFYGKSVWQTTSILAILQNEKYCGDVMYQKTYCVDCLKMQRVTN